jgi:hypothetical protein
MLLRLKTRKYEWFITRIAEWNGSAASMTPRRGFAAAQSPFLRLQAPHEALDQLLPEKRWALRLHCAQVVARVALGR